MTKLMLSSRANGQQNRNFVASGSGSGWPLYADRMNATK